MKHYTKAILALAVLAALPLMAATEDDETIYVTTFADEDGENSNACSLREAITAAAQNKPYGGCGAGKTSSSNTDVIQLEAGEYTLQKPLTPTSMLNILGVDPTIWNEKDVITGDYPAKDALQTTIKGNGQFGLIDTTSGKATLTLTNLKLTGGSASLGGAVKTGGSLNLVAVEISDVQATTQGGAIYLSGVGSSVNMNNSIIRNANAPKGAVLAMSCQDNLVFTDHTVSITNSSIVNNGNTASASILEFCGVPVAKIHTSTIAHNTAKTDTSSNGSIIKFTADSYPDSGDASILSNSSSLEMVSNTVVNNTAFSTLLYDSIGSKSLSYNILAYNEGLSCRHLLGGVAPEETGGISLTYNGLIKSATTKGFCDVPYRNDTTSIDLSAYSQSTVMTNMLPADKYTAFMPMYFLKNTTNNPLINVDAELSSFGCSSTDQRGVSGLFDSELLLDGDRENACDVGSTGFSQLLAADITGTNVSQLSKLNGYETQRDAYKKLVEDPNTDKKYLDIYKIRQAEFEQEIENFKANRKYRQVYIDIFENSLPQEISQANSLHQIQHLDSALYNVTTDALGTGPDVLANSNIEDLPTEKDPGLKCEWDSKAQQLLLYRTDGKVSQSGDYSYCKYTISLKSDPSVKSTGIAQATFINIAPVANNDNYTLNWGTDQRVKLDLLANDNDDGDGTVDQPNYPKDKKKFYVYPDGISAPIKFSKIDSNLVIEAEYTRPCPDETRDTCYGGDIYVRPKNTFNKFNYDLTYQIFDADATLSTTTAQVILTNTATTTDDTRKGSSGGSFGIMSIIALSGLALLRAKRKKS